MLVFMLIDRISRTFHNSNQFESSFPETYDIEYRHRFLVDSLWWDHELPRIHSVIFRTMFWSYRRQRSQPIQSTRSIKKVSSSQR